jgi:hypothetical protein
LSTGVAPDVAVNDGEGAVPADHELTQDLAHLLDMAEDDNVTIVGTQFREKLLENSEFARLTKKVVGVNDGGLGSTID